MSNYEELKRKNIIILSVSLDEDEKKWKEASKKDGICWYSLRDERGFENSEIKNLYHVTNLPTTFLVSPKGVILIDNPTIEEISK